ncbi:4'-phosphopantetheinyl transferase superfamily protein [Kitasatospora aureofaciens]|uniref:4'-phosphopantetheinyl transferase superfamily protein n=1 Tax=Kitasatospora aureofaciens TaxID=1894 RepID=UPI00131ACD8E|nr:4'-phosphopantetheinyl transferase superfamily protein [Kitasatospora aureofaciens]HJD83553.1 4'-phosphopantetheinyl transferase superfamily protein [Kitasatospora aureofaciens]
MSLETSWVAPPHGPAEQFTAGRRAAAAALAAAGSAERTVPRARDGRPLFPHGFAGSISHTGRLAVAVVVPGAEAVGVDIEPAAMTPRMAAFVLREQERRLLLPPRGPHTARDLFAAKEAAFKALNCLGTLGEFLFWQIHLGRSEGVLTATYRGESVPVWIHAQADLSFAVAIRR